MLRNRLAGVLVAALGFGGVVGASGVALAQEYDDDGGGAYDGGDASGPMDPATFDNYMDTIQSNSDAWSDSVEDWTKTVIREDYSNDDGGDGGGE